MSKIKSHPCGNCIGFGDEVCMQNYLDCDYSDKEEEKEVKNKFKVGDKVRFVGDYTLFNKGVAYGKIYYVHNVESESRIDVRDGFCVFPGINSNSFELVKEEEKKFHSSHYESDNIEPIEMIMSNKMDFCRASILKYAFRAGKKEGQEVLDIKKIIDYALLLAQQEGIQFTKEDAQSIIDYRFKWQEERK